MVRIHTPEKEEKRREGRIVKWESDVPLPSVPNTNIASFLLNKFASHGEKKALVRRVGIMASRRSLLRGKK